MSRRDPERLQDILDAIEAIKGHVARGDLSDGLIFDAVRVRLMEIGEAIKAVSPELLETEPSHPWSDIARMRDRLAHRYFDTTHSQVAGVVAHDLDPLRAAILRMEARLHTANDGGFPALSPGRPLTSEDVAAALDEE